MRPKRFLTRTRRVGGYVHAGNSFPPPGVLGVPTVARTPHLPLFSFPPRVPRCEYWSHVVTNRYQEDVETETKALLNPHAPGRRISPPEFLGVLSSALRA